jgi:hypothetical protein
MEDEYLRVICELIARNEALTSQRNAAMKDAQRFHNKNERLEAEVRFLHGDVACLKVELKKMKKELYGEENEEMVEELEEGEIEEEVGFEADPVPEAKKTLPPWKIKDEEIKDDDEEMN